MSLIFNDLLSFFLLIIIIGGIISGIFTATEASAIAVLYSIILGFIYKELSIKNKSIKFRRAFVGVTQLFHLPVYLHLI